MLSSVVLMDDDDDDVKIVNLSNFQFIKFEFTLLHTHTPCETNTLSKSTVWKISISSNSLSEKLIIGKSNLRRHPIVWIKCYFNSTPRQRERDAREEENGMKSCCAIVLIVV